MKTWRNLTLTLIFIVFGVSVGLYFPDTPEGLALKLAFEQQIDALWDEQIIGRADVIIDAPSLGTNVTVLGIEMEDGIFGFQGIKFADADRFQIPEILEDYDDGTVINATDFGFKCPQSSSPRSDEDEHCQYLNVYTPQHPQDINEKLPVMVYIYGGAFVVGSSNGYLPDYLVVHDVILVTINYRLGALGFFTLNTDEAPGNYALYDQREALRWVRNNIADFGGDKECITVFGESAGSVSASYMTIVADEDTIHRAISESGTFSEVWSVDLDPLYATNYVANEVGCLDTVTLEVNMTCMLEADQFDLTAAELSLVAEDRRNGLMGFRGCAPTIQPESLTDTLVTKMPQLYYEEGDFNHVPYLIGTNKDEGSLITLIVQFAYLMPNRLYRDEEYLREQAVTDILHSFGVDDPSHALSNSLILEYCFGVDLGDFSEAAPCLIDMFGVLFLKAGGWKVANLHSAFSTKETYHYSFDYDTGSGFLSELVLGYEIGVIHGAELYYLFPMGRIRDETSQNVSDRMTTLWTNFAKYGNPTPIEETNWENLDIPEFTPYHFEDHHYMLMRSDFIMQNEFPLRWTIRYDEEVAGVELTMEPPSVVEEESVAEEIRKDFIEAAENEVKEEEEVPGISSRVKDQDDVDEMEKKRDAYMITMIVFIVTFCIAVGLAIYFYMLTKR